jgi:hypothetical protein
MVRQLFQTVFMCATLLVAMYLTGQRMPWQPHVVKAGRAEEQPVYLDHDKLL